MSLQRPLTRFLFSAGIFTLLFVINLIFSHNIANASYSFQALETPNYYTFVVSRTPTGIKIESFPDFVSYVHVGKTGNPTQYCSTCFFTSELNVSISPFPSSPTQIIIQGSDFTEYINPEDITSAPNIIEINQPQDGQNLSSNVFNWNIGYTLNQEYSKHIDFELKTSQNTSTLENYAGNVCSYPYSATSGQLCAFVLNGGLNYFTNATSGSFQYEFQNPIAYNSSTYYARAWLFQRDSVSEARTYLNTSSTIINFSIGSSTIEIPNLIPIEPTINNQSNEQLCENFSQNIFGVYVCRVLLFLFRPSDNDFSQFTTLKSAVINKPPFGYFSQIQNVLNGFSTSTPAYALATSAPLTDNVFNPLKTGLSWILWLVFGFWIFYRIKHFEF